MVSNRKHVAVLTFPFSSHPRTITTLLLKMANSSPNILFSFFNTLNSNRSLLSSSSHDLDWPSNIKIHNVEDGVPPGHQFSSGHRREPMEIFLKVAGEILKSKIQSVAAETGINFTCIVTDAFLAPFACQIAEKLSISFIPVWTGLPCFLAAHSQIHIIRHNIIADHENLDEDRSLDFIPGLSLMRVKDLPGDMISSENDWKESVFLKTLSGVGDALSKATAVAVTSFEELNPEPLNIDFKSKFRHFLNLGIIADSNLSSSDSDSDPEGCLSWLDRQQFKSVVYISFGTIESFPDKELQELAEALEFRKIPFLWSLKDNLKQKLPNGFVERTSNYKQGKIVAWTPQRLVLGHDSVAVFISHAGYNAVRESIVHGVPMICRPVFGDQMMAARLVEEGWGIGVKVEDGVISRDGLLKSLDLLLADDDENEKRKKIRENVNQLRKIVLMASQPGGSATRDFNKFMQIISTV